jgi:hypothetical protein
MPKGCDNPFGKDGNSLSLAVRSEAAQHANAASLAFGYEQIAVGRPPDQARIGEPGYKFRNGETRQRMGPGIRRTRDHVRTIVRRFSLVGLRQVRWCDLADGAGRFTLVIGESGLGLFHVGAGGKPRARRQREKAGHNSRGSQHNRRDSKMRT